MGATTSRAIGRGVIGNAAQGDPGYARLSPQRVGFSAEMAVVTPEVRRRPRK